MSPEPQPQAKLPIPTIEEIILSEEFMQTRGSQQQLDCLVRNAKVQEHVVILVSKITVGQRDNPAWHLARKGRLTASNFGSVLQAKRVTPSLLKRLLGEYDLTRVKAVQWGLNNEEEALKAFTNLTGITVTETGLWLDGPGILGASPDGIVDEDSVLELEYVAFEMLMSPGVAISTSVQPITTLQEPNWLKDDGADSLFLSLDGIEIRK
ncbi:hypothetical protein ACROYT_G013875 [Oculina patagonica]